MIAEHLILRFAEFNGQPIKLDHLKDYHAKVQRYIENVGNGPFIPDLVAIHKRVTRAIKTFNLQRKNEAILEFTAPAILPAIKETTVIHQADNTAIDRVEKELSKIKSELSVLKRQKAKPPVIVHKTRVVKDTSGKSPKTKSENKTLIKAKSLPRTQEEPAVKKTHVGDLPKPEPIVEPVPVAMLDGLSGDQIGQMNFTKLTITGPWKQDFGTLFADTQMMFWGEPGSGKTVYILKLAKYLAMDLGLKVLFVANEELGRSTFTEKINEFDIKHPNLTFFKNLKGIDLNQYQVIVLDSINSMRMNLDDYVELHDNNPGKLFILVVQSTKDGDFRGGKDWEHEMDFAGEIVDRRLIVRKNRNDPDFGKKRDELLIDAEVKKGATRQLIKKKVLEQSEPVKETIVQQQPQAA